MDVEGTETKIKLEVEKTFGKHEDEVNACVYFGPPKNIIVTCSDDGTLKFFNTITGDLITNFQKNPVNANSMNSYSDEHVINYVQKWDENSVFFPQQDGHVVQLSLPPVKILRDFQISRSGWIGAAHKIIRLDFDLFVSICVLNTSKRPPNFHVVYDNKSEEVPSINIFSLNKEKVVRAISSGEDAGNIAIHRFQAESFELSKTLSSTLFVSTTFKNYEKKNADVEGFVQVNFATCKIEREYKWKKVKEWGEGISLSTLSTFVDSKKEEIVCAGGSEGIMYLVNTSRFEESKPFVTPVDPKGEIYYGWNLQNNFLFVSTYGGGFVVFLLRGSEKHENKMIFKSEKYHARSIKFLCLFDHRKESVASQTVRFLSTSYDGTCKLVKLSNFPYFSDDEEAMMDLRERTEFLRTRVEEFVFLEEKKRSIFLKINLQNLSLVNVFRVLL